MTNKKIWLGMLAIVLVFGMMIISCKDDEINILDEINYKTGNPSSEFLNISGLNQSQYSQIVTAAGGGFKGWALIEGDGYSEASMAWTGRSKTNFYSVANALKTIFGTEQQSDEDDGWYSFYDDSYYLEFWSEKMSEGGYYVPAGAMMLSFQN